MPYLRLHGRERKPALQIIHRGNQAKGRETRRYLHWQLCRAQQDGQDRPDHGSGSTDAVHRRKIRCIVSVNASRIPKDGVKRLRKHWGCWYFRPDIRTASAVHLFPYKEPPPQSKDRVKHLRPALRHSLDVQAGRCLSCFPAKESEAKENSSVKQTDPRTVLRRRSRNESLHRPCCFRIDAARWNLCVEV